MCAFHFYYTHMRINKNDRKGMQEKENIRYIENTKRSKIKNKQAKKPTSQKFKISQNPEVDFGVSVDDGNGRANGLPRFNP